MKTPVRVKLAFLLCTILIAAAFAIFVGLRLRRPHPQACDFAVLSAMSFLNILAPPYRPYQASTRLTSARPETTVQ